MNRRKRILKKVAVPSCNLPGSKHNLLSIAKPIRERIDKENIPPVNEYHNINDTLLPCSSAPHNEKELVAAQALLELATRDCKSKTFMDKSVQVLTTDFNFSFCSLIKL